MPRKKDVTSTTQLTLTLVSDRKGRKPKGGKLTVAPMEYKPVPKVYPAVILHLKCHLTDLEVYDNTLQNPLHYNPKAPPEIKYYQPEDHFYSFTEKQSSSTTPNMVDPYPLASSSSYAYPNTIPCFTCTCHGKDHHPSATTPTTPTNTSTMMTTTTHVDSTSKSVLFSKLKTLKQTFYSNSPEIDKKSACFWCSYEYEGPSCLIPRYETNGTMSGYGDFCSPECAVAFLFKEHLDDSTKFERYHLINRVYGKIYEYSKNIQPAPNPHYTLSKYFGNLNIEEYRQLSKTDHLLSVLEKPMTRLMPEIHQEFHDITNSNQIYTAAQTTTSYRVKKKTTKTHETPMFNMILG